MPSACIGVSTPWQPHANYRGGSREDDTTEDHKGQIDPTKGRQNPYHRYQARPRLIETRPNARAAASSRRVARAVIARSEAACAPICLQGEPTRSKRPQKSARNASRSVQPRSALPPKKARASPSGVCARGAATSTPQLCMRRSFRVTETLAKRQRVTDARALSKRAGPT